MFVDRFEQYVEDDVHYLEIYETKVEDSGLYKVTAINNIGSANCECQLTIAGNLVSYTFPWITFKSFKLIKF